MPRFMRKTDELAAAFKYSWQGFKVAWRGEVAFRQYLIIASLLIPLAFFLGNNASEKALLIFSALLVLLVELLNTAVEATIDRISVEHHELSRAAKDLGSAAVLLSVFIFLLVWGIILWN